MAFDRIFTHYNSAFTSSSTLPTDLVSGASFELLRQGGCGSGELTLAESFDSSTLSVGDHIQFGYTTGQVWYLGRVEEIKKSSPSGTQVRLYGWLSYLNDLALGGRGLGDSQDPIVYADDDYFESDPDFDQQTRVDTASIEEVVTDIHTNIIATNTPITTANIETPTENDEMKSMVFRGEENTAQIIRSLAVSAGWMSWGVDPAGDFFMVNLPVSTTHTYQEGVDAENLSETTDRSMMYNRVILTGGPVYGTGDEHGFYHYKKNVVHWPSFEQYGEKKISLHLPWIRTDTDAQKFFEKFFQEYAGLTVQYDFDVSGVSSLPFPWTSRVALLDYAGNALKNAVPTRVHVKFDHTPVVSIHLGPEDLQFPVDSHPNRTEDFDPTDLGDGSPINCNSLTYPLAPSGGWPDTWDCDEAGGWQFGYTTEDIVGNDCIVGLPAVTTCQKVRFNSATGAIEEVTGTFQMYSFDPGLDGTPAGTAVIARKIKGLYWSIWVGCEAGNCNTSSSSSGA